MSMAYSGDVVENRNVVPVQGEVYYPEVYYYGPNQKMPMKGCPRNGVFFYKEECEKCDLYQKKCFPQFYDMRQPMQTSGFWNDSFFFYMDLYSR